MRKLWLFPANFMNCWAICYQYHVFFIFYSTYIYKKATTSTHILSRRKKNTRRVLLLSITYLTHMFYNVFLSLTAVVYESCILYAKTQTDPPKRKNFVFSTASNLDVRRNHFCGAIIYDTFACYDIRHTSAIHLLCLYLAVFPLFLCNILSCVVYSVTHLSDSWLECVTSPKITATTTTSNKKNTFCSVSLPCFRQQQNKLTCNLFAMWKIKNFYGYGKTQFAHDTTITKIAYIAFGWGFQYIRMQPDDTCWLIVNQSNRFSITLHCIKQYHRQGDDASEQQNTNQYQENSLDHCLI